MDIRPLEPSIGTHSPKRALGIIVVNIILFIILYNVLPFDSKANSGICLLVFIGILWLTEAIHVTITALLIPLLAVVLGLLDTSNALKSFANPIIFLFFGEIGRAHV